MGYIQKALATSLRPIQRSPEFTRIDQLPRRLAPDVREGWADQYALPGGKHRDQQAQSLWELSQCGGLLCDMALGSGKTLVLLQAGVVLKAKSVVLLVPASLKAKTQRDLIQYGRDFKVPDKVHIVTYESLSLAKNQNILEDLCPDLICGDEAHKIARHQSTRTKRLRKHHRRYAPHTVWASGTLITRSIKDAAPLASMALGAQSPYPRDYQTLDPWSYAVDDGVLFDAEPGVLTEWCQPGESTREGLRRRVRDTRGVVGGEATGESACAASLVFLEAKVKVPKAMTEHLKALESKWVLPDGTLLDDPLSTSRAREQLSLGYYLRWIWPRGESEELRQEWFSARRDWNTAVYQKLKGRGRLDSPYLCYQAAASGEWAESSFPAWAAIKDQCKPLTECVWVSDFAIQAAAKWARAHKGIVWVDSPDFGVRVADLAGVNYYGGGGASDPEAEDGSRSCVVSIRAHSDGLNLQKAYGTMLYTSIPRTAKVFDQSIGRAHRPGQPRDEVHVYLYQHSPGLKEALADARSNAKFVKDISARESKLLIGTWVVSS